MGDKKRDGDTTNLHSLYTCSKSMSLDIPKSVSRWSTWRQGKKTHQDSCWCAKFHLTWNLSVHAAHASRLCKKMDSLVHHRMTPPKDYLLSPYTALGFREGQQNKTQKHIWLFLKGKVSWGCCSTWSDSPPAIYLPMKMTLFQKLQSRWVMSLLL